MFGDPVSNPKAWPVESLSEGVESFDGGRNVTPINTARCDGMRVLKESAVTSGEFLDQESKSFGEDYAVPADYIVKTGDLLISRANISELVGAVAYVCHASGRSMLPDRLWRFVWSKPAKIHPLFMLHMARSEHFRKQFILRATGSSGSMKNIGKVKMLEIQIPLPPIDKISKSNKRRYWSRHFGKRVIPTSTKDLRCYCSIAVFVGLFANGWEICFPRFIEFQHSGHIVGLAGGDGKMVGLASSADKPPVFD